MSDDKEDPKGVLSHTEAIFRQILNDNKARIEGLQQLEYALDKNYRDSFRLTVQRIKENTEKILQLLGE